MMLLDYPPAALSKQNYQIKIFYQYILIDFIFFMGCWPA